jgi:hypothetical protein
MLKVNDVEEISEYINTIDGDNIYQKKFEVDINYTPHMNKSQAKIRSEIINNEMSEFDRVFSNLLMKWSTVAHRIYCNASILYRRNVFKLFTEKIENCENKFKIDSKIVQYCEEKFKCVRTSNFNILNTCTTCYPVPKILDEHLMLSSNSDLDDEEDLKKNTEIEIELNKDVKTYSFESKKNCNIISKKLKTPKKIEKDEIILNVDQFNNNNKNYVLFSKDPNFEIVIQDDNNLSEKEININKYKILFI